MELRCSPPKVGEFLGRATHTTSLKVFRVLLGMFLVFAVARAVPQAPLFLSDDGWLPTAFVRTYSWYPYMMVHGARGIQLLLFFHIFIAILYTLGVGNRIVDITLLVLTVSLHARNPHVTANGDAVLRFMLFWGLFLPLRSGSRGVVLSPGVGLFLLQVTVMYATATATKWFESSAWRDGAGVCSALSMEEFVTPFGTWLQPGCGHFADGCVLLAETVCPALFWLRPTRVATLRVQRACWFGLLFAHLTFGAALSVMSFSIITSIAWIPLFPVAYDNAIAVALPSHEKWLGVACAALMIAGNVLGVGPRAVPALVDGPLRALGLQQGFHMFASDKPATTWLVIPTLLADGSVVDLAPNPTVLKPRALSYARPAAPRAPYFLRKMALGKTRLAATSMAQFICRRQGLSQPIIAVTIIGVVQPIAASGVTMKPELLATVRGSARCDPQDLRPMPSAALRHGRLGLDGVPMRAPQP